MLRGGTFLRILIAFLKWLMLILHTHLETCLFLIRSRDVTVPTGHFTACCGLFSSH